MNTRLKGEWGIVTFSYSIPLTNILKKEEMGDVVVGWLAGWLEAATGPGVAYDALCSGLIITDLTCDVDPDHWVNSVLHL